ncbi:MAG: bifunctional folylpolyglutamate synthase/dihydrofolate synthase [Coprococcus sp.]
MNYEEAEAYINSIPRFSKIKSGENVDDILDYFGHPERKFSYIHVAGTNGKGSVCAFLDSMLRAAGKKTGLFTSPHLITTAERIKVDGKDISREQFAEIFDELMTVVKKRRIEGHPHPTYFEWLYLMAMIWFGRCGIEYGVIETGLGGRLDATNQIDQPVLTVITSISYDHMEILGQTLTDIAGEKAGILKKNVPVICDGSEEEALAVIRDRAEALHCPMEVLYPQQVKILLNRGKNIDFLLQDMYDEIYRIHLHTDAVYQTMNGSLAWMAMRKLQQQDDSLQSIADDVLLQGMAEMHWPGRMEEILPDVYVDGAHNVGGIRKLRESLMLSFAGRPLWLVFAVASDKEYDQMIEILCTIPDLKGVIVTELENSRKTDLETVAAIFEKNWHGYVGHSYNINKAIREGRERAGTCENGMLLCAGSLYLAGSVMEALR